MLRGPHRSHVLRQLPGADQDLPRQRLILGLLLAALGELSACGRGGSDGKNCFDVFDLQVCDGHLAERRLPPGPAPPRGWRCVGTGESRRCVDRAAASGPWRCDASTCEERQPRQPDDGMWECADLDGAVVCHGGTPPAGVIAGPPDEGWTCGPRRGAPAAAGDRVCVDLSPDLPEGAGRGWKCTFTHERGERRLCRRDASAPAIGAACDDARGCKNGDRCLDRHCLPTRPQPSCWIDPDCAAGTKCLRGSCT